MSAEQKAEMKAVAQEYLATLELTEDQQEQFQQINQKYAGKLMDLKASGGSMFAKRKKAKNIKSDKDAELKAMLSADQYDTYQDFKDELAAKQ